MSKYILGSFKDILKNYNKTEDFKKLSFYNTRLSEIYGNRFKILDLFLPKGISTNKPRDYYKCVVYDSMDDIYVFNSLKYLYREKGFFYKNKEFRYFSTELSNSLRKEYSNNKNNLSNDDTWLDTPLSKLNTIEENKHTQTPSVNTNTKSYQTPYQDVLNTYQAFFNTLDDVNIYLKKCIEESDEYKEYSKSIEDNVEVNQDLINLVTQVVTEVLLKQSNGEYI